MTSPRSSIGVRVRPNADNFIRLLRAQMQAKKYTFYADVDADTKKAKAKIAALTKGKHSVGVDVNLDAGKARAELLALTKEHRTAKFEIQLESAKAKAELAAWNAELTKKHREARVELDLSTREARLELANFTRDIKSKHLESKLDIDLSTREARLKLAEFAAEHRQAKMELDLDATRARLAAQGFAAELKNKWLESKLDLDLTTREARAKLAEFTADVKAKHLEAKLDLDLVTREARAELAEFTTSNRKMALEVDLDTRKARLAAAELANQHRQATMGLDLDTKKARLELLELRLHAAQTKLQPKVEPKLAGLASFEKMLSGAVGKVGKVSLIRSLDIGPFNLGKPTGITGTLLTLTALAGAAPGAVAGLAAVSKALVDLAGAAAIVPGAIGTVMASISTIAVGTHGVSDAFSAMFDMWNEGSDAQQSQAKATVAAHNSLRNAVVDEARAQEEVGNARRDALNDLRNLNNELRGSVLNEAQAILDLQKARDRLAKGGFTDQNDQLQARLDVAKAEQNILDVRERNVQLQQKASEAGRKGVEGSDRVRDALENVVRAQQAIATAQQAIADTASAGAASKFNDLLAQLSPNARNFVEAIAGLRGPMHDLKNMVQDTMFSGLGTAFTDMFNSIGPTVTLGMRAIAQGLNRNILQVFDSLKSPQGVNIIERILGGTASTQQALTKLVDPLVRGLGTLMAAGAEHMPQFVNLMEKLLTRFATFIETADKSGALDNFMDRGITSLERMIEIGLNLVKIMNDLGNAFGGDLLRNIQDLTTKWHTFLSSQQGQDKLKAFIKEAADLWGKWKPVLKDLPDLLGAIGDGASAFLTVALPLLKDFTQTLKAAPELVTLLTAALFGMKTVLPVISTISNLMTNIALRNAALKGGAALPGGAGGPTVIPGGPGVPPGGQQAPKGGGGGGWGSGVGAGAAAAGGASLGGLAALVAVPLAVVELTRPGSIKDLLNLVHGKNAQGVPFADTYVPGVPGTNLKPGDYDPTGGTGLQGLMDVPRSQGGMGPEPGEPGYKPPPQPGQPGAPGRVTVSGGTPPPGGAGAPGGLSDEYLKAWRAQADQGDPVAKWVIGGVDQGDMAKRVEWLKAHIDEVVKAGDKPFTPPPSYGVGGYTNWGVKEGKMAVLHGQEYVQPHDTVDYYGTGVMEAMHKKQIPRSFFTGFEGGGEVTGSTWWAGPRKPPVQGPRRVPDEQLGIVPPGIDPTLGGLAPFTGGTPAPAGPVPTMADFMPGTVRPPGGYQIPAQGPPGLPIPSAKEWLQGAALNAIIYGTGPVGMAVGAGMDALQTVHTVSNWDQASGFDQTMAGLTLAGLLPIPGAGAVSRGAGAVGRGASALGRGLNGIRGPLRMDALDASRWANDMWPYHRLSGDFNPGQIESIGQYTARPYLNDVLRLISSGKMTPELWSLSNSGGRFRNAVTDITNIDAAMARSAEMAGTTRPFVVSRSVDPNAFGGVPPEAAESLIGQRFTDPGYLSTSPGTDAGAWRHKPYQLEIEVPPNMPSLWMNNRSLNLNASPTRMESSLSRMLVNQNELLLARGQTVIPYAIERQADGTVKVKARMAPYAKPPGLPGYFSGGRVSPAFWRGFGTGGEATGDRVADPKDGIPYTLDTGAPVAPNPGGGGITGAITHGLSGLGNVIQTVGQLPDDPTAAVDAAGAPPAGLAGIGTGSFTIPGLGIKVPIGGQPNPQFRMFGPPATWDPKNPIGSLPAKLQPLNIASQFGEAALGGVLGFFGMSANNTLFTAARQIGQHYVDQAFMGAGGSQQTTDDVNNLLGKYAGMDTNPAYPGAPNIPTVIGANGSALGPGGSTSKLDLTGMGVLPAAKGYEATVEASRAPAAQIIPNANIRNFMQAVGAQFGLHPGTSTVRPEEPGSQHSVGRAMDLYGSPDDMKRFAEWWNSDSGRVAATRQLIHYDPKVGFNNGLNIYGGRAGMQQAYMNDGSLVQHDDHVHLALEGVPASFFMQADGSIVLPNGKVGSGTAGSGGVDLSSVLGGGGQGAMAGISAAAAMAGNAKGGNQQAGGAQDQVRALAKILYMQAGMPPGEWDAFDQLIAHESGWNPLAKNPGSTAFGLGQFLDSTQATYGVTGVTDPVRQIMAIFAYLRGRSDYKGSPAAAWQAWQARTPHWYDKGGWLMPGLNVNETRKPEAVLTPGESQAFQTIARSLYNGGGAGSAPMSLVSVPPPYQPTPNASILNPTPPTPAPQIPDAAKMAPGPGSAAPSAAPPMEPTPAPPMAQPPATPAPVAAEPDMTTKEAGPATGVIPAIPGPGPGAGTESMNHVHPALKKGIRSAASTIGGIASMAINAAASAGSFGAAGAAGGAAGNLAAGLIQQGGKIIEGIANVPSSLLVGTLTGGTTQNVSGVTQRASNPSGSKVFDNSSHYGDVYTNDLDEYFRRQDLREAQATQATLARWG